MYWINVTPSPTHLLGSFSAEGSWRETSQSMPFKRTLRMWTFECLEGEEHDREKVVRALGLHLPDWPPPWAHWQARGDSIWTVLPWVSTREQKSLCLSARLRPNSLGHWCRVSKFLGHYYSGPQFPHLQDEANYSSQLVGLLGSLVRASSVVSNSFVTTWTVARQAPLPMRFSRQEYWSG